jgi:hypothetical protein
MISIDGRQLWTKSVVTMTFTMLCLNWIYSKHAWVVWGLSFPQPVVRMSFTRILMEFSIRNLSLEFNQNCNHDTCLHLKSYLDAKTHEMWKMRSIRLDVEADKTFNPLIMRFYHKLGYRASIHIYWTGSNKFIIGIEMFINETIRVKRLAPLDAFLNVKFEWHPILWWRSHGNWYITVGGSKRWRTDRGWTLGAWCGSTWISSEKWMVLLILHSLILRLHTLSSFERDHWKIYVLDMMKNEQKKNDEAYLQTV